MDKNSDNQTSEQQQPYELHLHEHNAPIYNINIGYVDKQINGDYYEYGHGRVDKDEVHKPESHKPEGHKPEAQKEDEKQKPGGRKKALFANNQSQYTENLEVKKREALRLRDFLQKHKLSNAKLSTQRDRLNLIIVAFLRRWRDSRLIGKEISGAAVFRFLTEDVKLVTDVEQRSYANKITTMVDSLDVNVEVEKQIAEAFK